MSTGGDSFVGLDDVVVGPQNAAQPRSHFRQGGGTTRAIPSAIWMRQPCSCTARWCGRHRQTRLSSSVGPSSDQWMAQVLPQAVWAYEFVLGTFGGPVRVVLYSDLGAKIGNAPPKTGSDRAYFVFGGFNIFRSATGQSDRWGVPAAPGPRPLDRVAGAAIRIHALRRRLSHAHNAAASRAPCTGS